MERQEEINELLDKRLELKNQLTSLEEEIVSIEEEIAELTGLMGEEMDNVY